MKETVKFKDIPKGYCFTFEGGVYVYYEDTERGGSKRTFHSYKDGQLWRSAVYIQNENENFYLCDRFGNYIPLSIVKENIRLRAEVKELKSKLGFTPTLTTGYVNEL